MKAFQCLNINQINPSREEKSKYGRHNANSDHHFNSNLLRNLADRNEKITRAILSSESEQEMKIEIDLKDILQDEYENSETLSQSIKRQVVESITANLAKGIERKIDEEVSKAIDEQIKKSLDEIRPNLITQILDEEYTVVDRYGSRSKEKTTFRNQLIKVVTEEFVYKKSSYNSDKNPFTRAVDEVLEMQAKAFKKQFDELISANYVAETKAYAVKVLKEKLGF